MNGNSEKLKAIHALRVELQRALVKRGDWQSCVNCCNFTNSENGRDDVLPNAKLPYFCIYYKAAPPAHIIVCGCEQHDPDIPF